MKASRPSIMSRTLVESEIDGLARARAHRTTTENNYENKKKCQK